MPRPISTPLVIRSSVGVMADVMPTNSKRVENATYDDYPPGPVTVGQSTSDGLGRTPDQVLKRHGQAEQLPAPADIDGHRHQVQPKSLTNAQRDGEQHGAHAHHHKLFAAQNLQHVELSLNLIVRIMRARAGFE